MLIIAVKSDIVNCQQDKSIALSRRAIIAAVFSIRVA